MSAALEQRLAKLERWAWGTASAQEAPETLHCSFCSQSQHEVSKLIAGPSVFICDECVDLCMVIILEQRIKKANPDSKVLS